MAIVGRTEVAGCAAHGADGAAGEAHRDRIVELHLGVQRRAHEREYVLATQVGQPQRDTQQVRQLRLAIAAAARLGPRPGVRLGHGVGIGAGVVARLGQQLSGHRVHVQRDLLDLADAIVLVHHPVRLDDHRPVVPAIGHEQLPAGPLDRLVELPGIGRVDGEGLLAHHVRAGLEGGLGLCEVMYLAGYRRPRCRASAMTSCQSVDVLAKPNSPGPSSSAGFAAG